MKKITLFALLTIISVALTSSYVLKMDSNGKAGYTGSPGESTCSGGSGCHNGGNFASPGVSLSTVPTFSNNEYYPDTLYSVTVTVSATGCSKFGFGGEVLNSSNTNSGTLTLPGAGVKLVNIGRRNVTHSAPKTTAGSATFTFKWQAPPAGTGKATFYICGNATNASNNTSGDMPIPFSYSVAEAVVAQPTLDVSAKDNNYTIISLVSVFPNPSNGQSLLSYYLKTQGKITADLIDISGKKIKELYSEVQTSGNHSETLNLQEIPKGVYFLRINYEGEKPTQKLLTIN